MKKKPKTPRTIADLKINWVFGEEHSQELFQKLNPKISNLVIKSEQYSFKFENTAFLATSNLGECLASYMTYVSLQFSFFVKKTVKLISFEKVSETEYIIHGKNYENP